MSSRALLLGAVCTLWSCGATTPASAPAAPPGQETAKGPQPVGLSVLFTDGKSPPISLVGDAPRYLQELDIVASVTTPTDDGITPLLKSSELSSLDWSGVTQVEEQWRNADDGTVTRERFFRNAKWMDAAGTFTLRAEDASGAPLGEPIVADTGTDDRWKPEDDSFVRRFVARQIATGCRAIGDCKQAKSFTAEGLVQLRNALTPERRARVIPPSAARLNLTWTAQPAVPRRVNVTHIERAKSPYGYGLQVSIAPATPPAKGTFYLPGDAVTFQVTLRDGEGNRLHPEGSLPTYGEFLADKIASGVSYLDPRPHTRLYYALKNHEHCMMVVMSGPTDKLRTPSSVVDPATFMGPQINFTTAAADGFTSVGVGVPSAAIMFGGFQDPAIWGTPVSDRITLKIPADAQPGTYVVSFKARREFGGEALSRGSDIEVQVGQPAATKFTPKTTCVACHSSKRTSFDQISHGIGDRRTCFGCHSSLGQELDNVLDIRVHTIHDRSRRFPDGIRECTQCHVEAPSGAARGLLARPEAPR